MAGGDVATVVVCPGVVGETVVATVVDETVVDVVAVAVDTVGGPDGVGQVNTV